MLRSKKFIFGIVLLVLVIVALLFYYVAVNSTTYNSQINDISVSELSPVESPNNGEQSTVSNILIDGDKNAPVKIVEYIDYKCPNCNRFHRSTAREIKSTYGSQVAFEIRAYPAFGPDSGRALRGSYCANDQKIFTEYHNIVMDYMWNEFYESRNFAVEIEDVLTTDVLVNLISSTSADISQFKACIDSTEKNEFIDRDLLAAAEDGIRATPGFAIGGQSFVGLQPQSVFNALIGKELTN